MSAGTPFTLASMTAFSSADAESKNVFSAGSMRQGPPSGGAEMLMRMMSGSASVSTVTDASIAWQAVGTENAPVIECVPRRNVLERITCGGSGEIAGASAGAGS